MCSSRSYLHPTHTHAWPEIPKYQEWGAQKKKNSMWGKNIKKTMSEKSLITKYALINILPGNANIQKIL